MIRGQDLIGIQGFHVLVEYDFWLLAGLFKLVGTASCRGESGEREQSPPSWRDCYARSTFLAVEPRGIFALGNPASYAG